MRIDWNEAWKERNRRFGHDHSADWWNERAEGFYEKRASRSREPFVELFYEYSRITPGETIFDMGCAAGTLAIPFAEKGHEVWAADFSPRMLEYLMKGARESGVEDRVHPVLLDWNEDWDSRDLPVCDVAIATRSLVCDDLTLALKKLESVANDRVCIGTWDKPTTHYDRDAARAIGYERPGYGSYVYVLNELIDRDMYPELRFIRYRFDRKGYQDIDELKRGIRESFQYGLTPEQEILLEKYFDENIVPGDKDGKIVYRLPKKRESTIAHIMWRTGDSSEKNGICISG